MGTREEVPRREAWRRSGRGLCPKRTGTSDGPWQQPGGGWRCWEAMAFPLHSEGGVDRCAERWETARPQKPGVPPGALGRLACWKEADWCCSCRQGLGKTKGGH